MIDEAPTVYVIDNDASVRHAIKHLATSVGLRAELFGSPQEFLDFNRPAATSCLVLDVRLSGRNGLDFHRELAERGISIPAIFITAHGDIPMTVRAMKAGAVEFLTKPFRDQDLLDAIQVALTKDRTTRERQAEINGIRGRFNGLSPREKEVVMMVVSGMLNKQIAIKIGTSENTVKAHRARAMEKMHAPSLADLVRMVDKVRRDHDSSPSTKAS